MKPIVLPIQTVSETNRREHWAARAGRAKVQRECAANMLRWHARRTQLPCIVTLTRVSAGTLDDDNLRGALKAVRDGIADAFRLDDRDPRIEWRYAQDRCARGEGFVRVSLEARSC